jgi:hypothetical protein
VIAAYLLAAGIAMLGFGLFLAGVAARGRTASNGLFALAVLTLALAATSALLFV